jgi:FlaA1/EpsC-like NDP-sugar epimerase
MFRTDMNDTSHDKRATVEVAVIKKRSASNPQDVKRFASRTAQHLVDLMVLSIAFALAFFIRFDGELPTQMMKRFLFLWPYVVGLQFAVLILFGVHRFAWRYVGLRETTRILIAIVTVSAVLFILRLLAASMLPKLPHAQYALLPIGVIAIDFGLAFLGITGVRVLRRLWIENLHARRHRVSGKNQATTLLIGAGRAGVLVAKELASRPDLGLRAIGFVDDDVNKKGTTIQGLPVMGPSRDLSQYVKRHQVEEVVITIAAASGSVIRRLVNICEKAGLTPKIIPGIWEILDGQVNLSRIREVSIEDLLGREAVHLEMDLVQGLIRDETIMVTGAGGSIGSELSRQISRMKPSRLLLVERSEPALFSIHRELRQSFPGIEVAPLLCDVQDNPRLEDIFNQYRPRAVFHAAAHKHVPLMELNPGEALKNNVFGTVNVAKASDKYGVETFVLVSTDKAVNPTSIMGTTKRVAEIYIQALSQRAHTKYVAVRFGNVLGSTGSVIPIFKEQIRAGGPVTITHPEMKRYFMTIPEASQLVMQAGAMGQGGEIFVLDMGEPVRIVDLAHDLIRLSGLEPEIDVAIDFIGMRPGEKLFEELGFDAEKMNKTRHRKIFVGRLAPKSFDEVNRILHILQDHTQEQDRTQMALALKQLVPEMVEHSEETRVSTPQSLRVNPAALTVADVAAGGTV